MSLSFGLSPWLLVILGALAAAGAVWMYRNTVPRVDGRGRVVLGGLRFLSLFILLFLLIEPLLTRESTESDPPVVAVLVDDSQSVGLALADSAGNVENPATAFLQSLGGQAEPRVYRFGAHLAPDEPDSARFTQGRTDISGALEAVREDLREENFRGVVLISDGRFNTGRNPIHVADLFPVPIHAVVVGDTTARRDVQIRRVLTNEIAYRGVALPMEVGVRHEGFGGTRVTVRVAEGGRVLDQQDFDLPAEDGESTVQLSVTPDTTGLVRYDVSVSRSTGEFTFRNNVASASVRVLESKQRVLVLAGAPGPDLTALRAAMGEDEDLEVAVHVRNPAGGYYQGTPPPPDDMDLIVLAGWPSAGTDLAEVDRIATSIDGGKAVLFVLDHATDLGLMQRLGNALPVQPRVRRSGRTEGRAVLTGAGARHPTLELPDGIPDDAWTALPPLRVTDVTWQTAPDAEVLATTSIRGVVLDDPALVVRRRSGARSAVLLASGTWRWANLPESLTEYDPVWPQFVESTMRWLTTPEDDRPVRVRTSQAGYEGGERVAFFGQVYDESSQPVSGATVDIQVRASDGSTLPFAMRSIGSGRYRTDAGTLPEGTYTWSATATRDNVELGTDNGVFSVGPLAIEYRDTRADAGLMRQVALRSSGSFGDLSSIDGVAVSIREGEGFQSRERVMASSVRLWQRYPFLILVLVLLTAEWFLRKRRGLV